MHKLFVLVAFVIGTVTAGRILQSNLQQDIGIANQRIQRMSEQDLQRQKFILDIVQGVRRQLQQDDLLQLDRGLITDPERYKGGIDGEMQRIIELDRQRRLLDEHQTYNINDMEHVQLLRGIYRLLVRAIDFETLQCNVVYLRRNANPVLLINALAMAVRDREDTQNLIMPAVQELLPEVYLDQEVIDRVQSLQSRLEQSSRPSITDLMNLRQRMQPTNPFLNIIMPWRDLRLALKTQQLQRIQNRVVFLPAENTVEGLSLVTEDVGMRNFVRNLIQELALQENRLQQRRLESDENRELNIDLDERRQMYGNIDDDLLLQLNRQRNQQLENDEEERERLRDDRSRINLQNLPRVPLQRNFGDQFPNVDVSSDRLLRVGRRRQNIESEIREGRRDAEDEFARRTILDQEIRQRIENLRNRDRNGDDNIQHSIDNLQSVRRDDERLVHINRRRLGQTIDNQNPRRVSSIGEGRRVEDEDNMPIEDVVRLIRNDNRLNHLSDEEITEMLRRNRQRKEQTERERFMGLVRGDRVSEGRRVMQEDEQAQDSLLVERMYEERRAGVRGVSSQDIRQRIENIRNIERGENEYQQSNENLPTVRRDDERLVHINRRRVDQQIDDRSPRRVSSIGEGRRVEGEDNMSVEDIMKLIRSDNRLGQLSDEEITEMLRRNRQRMQQIQNERNMGREDRISEGRRGERPIDETTTRDANQSGKIRHVRDVNNRLIGNIRQQLIDMDNTGRSDLGEASVSRRSAILMQSLRQLLARINQERISLRMSNDDLQLSDNSRLILPNQNQAQRYVLRLNEMRLDSRRNRVLIEQINALESRLQQVIGQLDRELVNRNTVSERKQVDQHLRIERVVGDVVLGSLGDVGILRILREQLQDVNIETERMGQYISLRSPVLQYALRRIVNIVDEQQSQRLGAYRREQLDMQTVKINDVRVSRLSTRIEEGDMDVSNMQGHPQRSDLILRQRRLNNKLFTISMDISSDRTQDVIVRVFLGPRQDIAGRELTLDERRSDFVLLDAISTKLLPGRNTIQQLSSQISWTTSDATPYSEIYRRVMTAMRNQQEDQLLTELVGENGRFPQRLLLPRGRPEGLPMQLLTIVSPMERMETRLDRIGGVIGISPACIMDKRSLGYPLDRRIENEQELLRLPNVQLQEVVITHEN